MGELEKLNYLINKLVDTQSTRVGGNEHLFECLDMGMSTSLPLAEVATKGFNFCSWLIFTAFRKVKGLKIRGLHIKARGGLRTTLEDGFSSS